jgi:hypothetical protein
MDTHKLLIGFGLTLMVILLLFGLFGGTSLKSGLFSKASAQQELTTLNTTGKQTAENYQEIRVYHRITPEEHITVDAMCIGFMVFLLVSFNIAGIFYSERGDIYEETEEETT